MSCRIPPADQTVWVPLKDRQNYHQTRMRAACENERKFAEVFALEKMLQELGQLFSRTRDYIEDCKQKLAVRDSILKVTQEIKNIPFASNVLNDLPVLPSRYNGHYKILDDDLINFLLMKGYVKPDFSDEERDNVYEFPKIFIKEREIYMESEEINSNKPESPDIIILETQQEYARRSTLSQRRNSTSDRDEFFRQLTAKIEGVEDDI